MKIPNAAKASLAITGAVATAAAGAAAGSAIANNVNEQIQGAYKEGQDNAKHQETITANNVKGDGLHTTQFGQLLNGQNLTPATEQDNEGQANIALANNIERVGYGFG